MKSIQEIAKILLPDEQNAIMLSERMHREPPKNGSVWYIDLSGIIRISEHDGKLTLVDGYAMPSRVKGKFIRDIWNEQKLGEIR